MRPFPDVSGLTVPRWNDSEGARAIPGVEHNTTTRTESRRPLRRLDNWTLYAFNPAFSRNATALSELVARQDTHPENRSTPMTDRIHRVLRRLDAWTLTVFNPYYASDHRH